MNYPQRKSPRLQGYDYSQSGAYFVTICSHERQYIFGKIQDETMLLNAIGTLAAQALEQIPHYWQGLDIDLWVIMPNHLHAIFFLDAELTTKKNAPLLGQIIANYKAGVTRRLRATKELETQEVLWQSRYHDRIIRNEAELNSIRQYIVTNPQRWKQDTFYNS